MNKLQFDKLGDRCKSYEMAEAGRRALPGIPLLARLDGRSFHTYTRGMKRPFDPDFSHMMVTTTAALVEEFQAAAGFTQSDEITLLWPLFDSQSETQYPFGGRIQKIQSVTAGMASAIFNRLALKYFPDKQHIPVFDCRVWQVPSPKDAVDVFAWRQADAEKNSVQMAARSVASHKELHGKGRKAQHDLLHAKGLNWNDFPPHQKRGVFVKRVLTMAPLSAETLEKIPPKKRPPADHMVIRSSYDVFPWQVSKLETPEAALFVSTWQPSVSAGVPGDLVPQS
jgi:tRNA(His) guanylyltransferase